MSGIVNYLKRLFRITPFSWPVIATREIIKHEKLKAGRRQGSNNHIQYLRVQPWFKCNGDNTLRINYELTEDSIVFDLGGYKGEFASAIMNKYDCNIFIFEPIPAFYNIILEKFSNNKKLHPYCIGLYDKTIKKQISLSDNGSSIYIGNTATLEIQLKNIIEFLDENNFTHIDLIKINIEGAEFELLECLINNDRIKVFQNIQVQFHDFIIDNAESRMRNIQNQLSNTHELTYQYEFVWENWRLRKESKS